MKAGSTGYIKIKLTTLDMSVVSSIIFTLKSNTDTIQKTYPTNVTLTDGEFYIGLNQIETGKLVGYVDIEPQINLTGGGVTKGDKKRIFIKDTLATTLMTGNTPTELEDVELEVEQIQIVSTGGTSDYDDLENRPQIEGVTLTGNKTASDLGLAKSSDIPDVNGLASKSYVDNMALKTINGQSIKGSGDIAISANSNALRYALDGKLEVSTSHNLCRVLMYDTNCVWLGGSGYWIEKIDTSGKNPTSAQAISLNTLNLGLDGTPMCKRMVKDRTGTYIYAMLRLTTGQTTRDKNNGAIVVFKASDMSVVNTIISNELFTDGVVYGDYLFAMRRTCGWAVYDISTPTSPTQVWESTDAWNTNLWEMQEAKLVTIGETPVLCICGFVSYIWFYDVSTPASPQLLTTIRLGLVSDTAYRGHSYSCEIIGTTMYATLAPTTSTYNEKVSGIIKIDLSDVLNGNVTHVLYKTPDDDVVTSAEGDAQPVGIVKWGKYFIEPASPKGNYVWKINDDGSLTYVKMWNIEDDYSNRYYCYTCAVDNTNRLIYPSAFVYDENGVRYGATAIKRQVFAFQKIEEIG